MQEENKTEIVELEEAKSCVLSKTKQAMRRSKKKILLSKICSISIPIIVAILLVGYPIVMHNINSDRETTKSWENLIEKVNVSYTDLKKTSSVSIEELNETKEAQFYWLENMTRTESYILTYQNKNVLIEEHYLYEGSECVLYVMNTNSQIKELLILNEYENRYIKNDDMQHIDYSIIDQYAYCKMTTEYNYLFKINSKDSSIIETILSNLTNS